MMALVHQGDLARVWEHFTRFASLSDREAAPWIDICHMALEQVVSSLKAGVGAEHPAWEEILCAAGAVASYHYALATDTSADDITLADIKIRGGGGRLESAARLREVCLARIAPYTVDRDFIFREV